MLLPCLVVSRHVCEIRSVSQKSGNDDSFCSLVLSGLVLSCLVSEITSEFTQCGNDDTNPAAALFCFVLFCLVLSCLVLSLK